MKTTVHQDGGMEPRQSANLILTEFDHPASFRDTRKATMRTFFCSDCRENFEAGVEADTVHDCEQPTQQL